MSEDSALNNSKYNVIPKNKNHHNHRQQQNQQNYSLSQMDMNNDTESGVQSTGLSFSNPVYELSNPSAGESALEALNHMPESLITATSSTTTPPQPSQSASSSDPLPNVAFKVEHVLAPSCTATGSNRRFGSFRSGLDSRWRVAQAIYPYMVCIALAYCVTLSLYPGIESEIISCNLKSWMPVLLMFMFNTSDVIGKVRDFKFCIS